MNSHLSMIWRFMLIAIYFIYQDDTPVLPHTSRYSENGVGDNACLSHWAVVGNVKSWLSHDSGDKPNTCTLDAATTSEASNKYGSDHGVGCCNDATSNKGSRPGATTAAAAAAMCVDRCHKSARCHCVRVPFLDYIMIV